MIDKRREGAVVNNRRSKIGERSQQRDEKTKERWAY
jgi:hypothetical protein